VQRAWSLTCPKRLRPCHPQFATQAPKEGATPDVFFDKKWNWISDVRARMRPARHVHMQLASALPLSSNAG
jgi:hypothetical protein